MRPKYPKDWQGLLLLEGFCTVGFDAVSTLHNFPGQSRKATGEFALYFRDPADRPSGRIVVRVDTLDTGNEGRDADLGEAMRAKEHAKIACELLGFAEEGARVRFTIAGRAREVTAPVEMAFDRRLLHVKGEVKLRMSDFGVRVKPVALGFVTVEDEVVAWWDLRAEVVRDAPR